ncbi:RNA recognition motif domain [Dillenia turbinata]|uniref:RNA recognition motif domain n=1 Tax=Dillenia turbinata TaxID=194707 RepID=A0AAN8ZU80_9MAGN
MESDLGKLFIGGISWDTDEVRLKEYFSSFGEVVEAVIMRDRTTGRARGFGFIVFADPAVAERVVMEKHMIDGRMVEAKKAVPKDDQHILNRNSNSTLGSPGPGRTKKIFVGGLPPTVTESDFKKYFEQYGTITDVVVMYDHNTQRPRGFGFITYDAEEAVDRVLLKTFHELNSKMVEVKRAVPKELSPGPSRSALVGLNPGLGRTNFLNSYSPGYNLSSIGGYGLRLDGRFNPVVGGRSGFPAFGSPGYGLGINMEPGLNPNYSGNSNVNSNLGYSRVMSPYYGGNFRYGTPIGGRSDSVLNTANRNFWGNEGLGGSTNPLRPGAYLGSGTGSFGVSMAPSGLNWSSSLISSQGGTTPSSYIGGNSGYGSGDSSFGLGGYGRNSGAGTAQASSISASSSGFEGSYGDFYRSSSVYGDSTWHSATSQLDGSFGYGLGNAASDVAQTSEEYAGAGGYSVTSRQSNRGGGVSSQIAIASVA